MKALRTNINLGVLVDWKEKTVSGCSRVEVDAGKAVDIARHVIRCNLTRKTRTQRDV